MQLKLADPAEETDSARNRGEQLLGRSIEDFWPSTYDPSVVDEIVPEPIGGAHTDPESTAAALRSALIRSVRELKELDPATLRRQRWQKYESLGAWREVAPAGA